MLNSISSISSLAALGFEHLLQNHTRFYNVLCFLESRLFIYTLYFGFVFVLKNMNDISICGDSEHPAHSPTPLQHPAHAPSHIEHATAVGRYIVYAHVRRMTAYVTHHVCTCPAVAGHIVYAHVQRLTAYVPIPLEIHRVCTCPADDRLRDTSCMHMSSGLRQKKTKTKNTYVPIPLEIHRVCTFPADDRSCVGSYHEN
jgi:hypothetical protein